MRDWNLTADNPLAMRFAADTRLGRTDYADDQSWEVAFGGPQEPGLIIQTRYGGRAGLARLVPMWVLNGRPVYEGSAFAARPVLRAFAPNYAKITIRLLQTLTLNAELWVMESHAVGGRFVMENSAAEPLSLRFELFAQVVREGSVIDMNLLGLDDGSEALHMGVIGNLNPILMMEYAAPVAARPGEHVSPKLSAPVTVPAKGWTTVRWVHAGLPSLNDSLQTAYRWLYQTNWDENLALIEQVNASTPIIETGNADWDAAIGLSAQVVLRSFVGPTGSLPYPSFVSARIPSRGFSPRGDGSDHGWQWNGQTAMLGYLALPAAAILSPDLARGAIRNALAVRHDDGWIDFKPGLGGQRANLLSAPLLATTAWRIYEITEDKSFIADVFPGLLRFFERWFQSDMDRDGDGLPEWTNTLQSGYPDNPVFARYRRWAHNADINKAESPDLAAYLIGEARSLHQMAELVGDAAAAAALKARHDHVLKQLDSMWDEAAGGYQYRDRDTHRAVAGKMLFRGKGDERFDARPTLDPPNRLILRVIGGRDHTPHVSAIIEGVDAQGTHVSETIPPTAFAWYYGMGAAVTGQVYSQVNYVRFEGLSRVYTVEIDTVDLTRQNQTLLLPLWAAAPGQDRVTRLIKTITDPARYWRPFGMPVCPVDDPAFAANNDGGSGGVWLLWNVLFIEGLLECGYTREAATLFGRLLDAQVRALRRDRAFREAYNSETGDGLGDLDELAGIVPLQLVMQLIGLRVIDSRKVWAGGLFALPNPVKVTQFGVEVSRSATGTTVRFLSGHVAEVGPEWQVIEDPTPLPVQPPAQEPATEQAQPIPATPEPPAAPTDVVVPPIPASIIPVDAKKDDTLEVPVVQADSTPPKDKPTDAPGAIKIPVRGPDGGS
jgi:hypothetical protein